MTDAPPGSDETPTITPMKIHVPRETWEGETRVPLVPASAKKLVDAGADLSVEPGIGEAIGVPDSEYEAAGAKVAQDPAAALAEAQMVLAMRPPESRVDQLVEGQIVVAALDPFRRFELVERLAARKVLAFAMDMMPRTTIAQKMDVLSSQANLAGYVAVMLAAARQTKILPMMSTPAGTIKPARVFIIGAGVAGLQAIATAKRLGAVVEAFDTRPVVEEQVKSLGAKFFKVDLGETGQTKDGYAKQLTEEQLARQREAMAAKCAESDVVITTAQLFGRPAPLIVTADMVGRMKPGSVLVDLAVETGGNIEGSKVGEEVVTENGARIVGLANLPGRVPVPASQVFSSNLANFVLHFWDKDAKTFKLDREEEHQKGCLVVADGEVVHQMIKDAMAKAKEPA